MMRISKSPHERMHEIVNAALELFLEHGYEKTSVSMIVERVGVAQGLFYYYFKSKEEVFQAAMQYHTDDFAQKLMEYLLNRESLSIAQRLERVLTTMREELEESELFFRDGFSVSNRAEIDIQFSYHFSLLLIEPVATLIRLLYEKLGIEGRPIQLLAAFIVFGLFGLIHGGPDVEHNTESLRPELLLPLFAGTLGVPVEAILNEKIAVPEEHLS